MNFSIVVRVWLISTLSLVAGLIVWELAPILFLVLLLVAGLGCVVAVMVAIARRLERWRASRP